MEAVDRLGPPRGKRVVVVTNAGGPAVLATDELGRGGVDLARTLGGTEAGWPRSCPPPR